MKLLNFSKLVLFWFTVGKWTLRALRFCRWLNTYRHLRENSALLQSCFLKTLKLLFVTVWRAIKPLHSVVLTDLLEVSIMKGIDKYKVCSIIMTKNKFEKSSNILTNLVLWMQFWVNNVYRLKIKIYFVYWFISSIYPDWQAGFIGNQQEII